jgi:hypothetical protein
MMPLIKRLLDEMLAVALFELASNPRVGRWERDHARAVLTEHDDGPFGRALRHADASRAASSKTS